VPAVCSWPLQCHEKHTQCDLCNIGSFPNASGATKCSACAAGLAAPLQGQSWCRPNAHYFGNVAGSWDVKYKDGSGATFTVAADGSITATTASEPVSGRLQPATGDDAASGWHFRLVDHQSIGDQYLLKTANGTLQVKRLAGSQEVQGTGTRHASNVHEPASFPVVPVAAGAGGAFVVFVVLCVLYLRRRRMVLKPEVSPNDAICNPSAECTRAIPPRFLGAAQCPSQDSLKTVGGASSTPRLLGAAKCPSQDALKSVGSTKDDDLRGVVHDNYDVELGVDQSLETTVGQPDLVDVDGIALSFAEVTCEEDQGLNSDEPASETLEGPDVFLQRAQVPVLLRDSIGIAFPIAAALSEEDQLIIADEPAAVTFADPEPDDSVRGEVAEEVHFGFTPLAAGVRVLRDAGKTNIAI